MTPTREILIDADGAELVGELSLPADPVGVVAFAHGSGSSRHSPRNQQVAARLQEAGLATLLLDLLTEDEEREDLRTRAHRFDIELLAARMNGAVAWLETQSTTSALPIGCFGASTGAAAALMAAAQRPASVRAVVSRGGRPDLAGEALPAVRAPTLLIVGGADLAVIDLNRQALGRLTCPGRLEIVPEATHLFPEPGALEAVADLAQAWFVTHLAEA